VWQSSAAQATVLLLLPQHAFDHVEEFVAVDLLLIVNLARKLLASEAVIHAILDGTLKDQAGMPHGCLEFLELLRSTGICAWHTTTRGTKSSFRESADFTS
jgi:hypothetical protein